MKQMKKIISYLIVCGLWMSFPATAEDLSNFELTEKIHQIEETLKEGLLPGDWAKRISLSGAVELEAGYEEIDFDDPSAEDEDSSDFSLATVELGIDADIAKHVKGHVLFLYEDDEDVVVDDGYILLDGEDVLPLYLKAGKLYVPFGKFETAMISDPLTLEIGETRETAVEVGFKAAGFYGALYAFNGDVDIDDDDNHINNFGVNLGYEYKTETISMNVGVGWINNIIDSNGATDMIEEGMEEAEEMGFSVALKEEVPGVAAYAILTAGPVTLIGEYVAMLEDIETELTDIVPGTLEAFGLGATEKGDKLQAWNIEVDYGFEIAGKETVLGVAYQGISNAEEGFPEARYMGGVSVGIMEGTAISLEYRHDEYETDDTADALTAKLAVEF